MSHKNIVLTGYRRLLRGASKLFGNDKQALTLGRFELRSNFEANRHVSDPKTLQELINGINEAAEMMENNLVQGRLNHRGNYEVELKGVEPANAKEGKKTKCSDNLFDPTPPEELLKEVEEGPAPIITTTKAEKK
mmetsp:Transcript_27745/g.33922  ORF Transcript_27745/g.33922 Transcript_27745/m.33922 type:complete len:135 (-) Transcript_27745:607-1011(-)